MVGAAVGLLVWSGYAINRDLLAAGEGTFGEEIRTELSPTMRLFIPYARSAGVLVGKVFRSETGPVGRLRRWITTQLLYAGTPGGLHPDAFIGLMIVWGLLFLGLGLAIVTMLDLERIAGMLVTGLGLLGFFLPILWLRDKANRRQLAIQKALPYSLDLMTLSMEAGLDFTVSLQRIVGKLGTNPLAQEFGLLLRHVQMGMSRKDALRGMKERASLMDMHFFVGALVQAEDLGVGLGPILRIQAESMRRRRFQRAEELAMKAPVKIVFPLLFQIALTIQAQDFHVAVSIQIPWQQRLMPATAILGIYVLNTCIKFP